MKKVELIDAYSKTGKIVPIKTKTVLRKVPFRKSKRVLGFKILYFSLYFIPLFLCLFIVSRNSNVLLKEWMSVLLLIGTVLSIWIAYLGFMMFMLNKKIKTGRIYKKWFKVLAATILVVYTLGGVGFTTLLYGPYDGFREWLITRAMKTMNHQYYATWFYGPDVIAAVFENHQIIEVNENTNPDLIKIAKYDGKRKTYANKYDAEILNYEEDEIYKVIDLNRDGYKGKLVAIYDPSKITLGVSQKMGTSLATAKGEMLVDMSKRYGAEIGINGGGFYDPDWNSWGGVPHGVVISEGKLLADNSKAGLGGGIIGFNKDDKLVLMRGTAKQAMDAGLRDAVEFGPYLIVNGKSSFIKGNGGWGNDARTAIGQRKDGIVLFVVIDGRNAGGSRGASMLQLTNLMKDYGAVNAGAMDGGTSSAMSYNHKLITNPRNSAFKPKTRPIPNAWLIII